MLGTLEMLTPSICAVCDHFATITQKFIHNLLATTNGHAKLGLNRTTVTHNGLPYPGEGGLETHPP